MDDHMLQEIFKTLPIGSLCRFRCVCKRWNSIISSPFFIKLHLNVTSLATPRNKKPFVHVRGNDPVLYQYDRDRRQQLNFPFRVRVEYEGACGRERSKFTLVDVIRGVVCICHTLCESDPFLDSIFLWNPTIRKYASVPSCPRLRTRAIGFGYDESKADFKVVTMSWTSIGTLSFNVYSAQQGLWRHLKGIHIDWISSLIRKNGFKNRCFVNGTIHWLLAARKDNLDYYDDDSDYEEEEGLDYHNSDKEGLDYFLLMFDCESEEFRVMDIPKEISSNNVVVLFECAGKIAVCPYRDVLDQWVMEEDGVSSSWKKLDLHARTLSPLMTSCGIVFDDESMFLMDHP